MVAERSRRGAARAGAVRALARGFAGLAGAFLICG
jgi:hypothetical protein